MIRPTQIASRCCLISSVLITILLLLTPAQGQESDNAIDTARKPISVFIMLGQSNMLGFGRVGPEDQAGTLLNLTSKRDRFKHWVVGKENWKIRKDVRYIQIMHRGDKMQVLRNEWLTVKGAHIGPELQFGYLLGEHLDQPVLLIKSCIGNRSLGWDLLPPGSARYEFDGKWYAGYRESPLSWDKGTQPQPIGWYAGKQYDDDIGNAKQILQNLKQYCPDFDGQQFSVEGIVWWQGHKDQNAAHASRYQQNLIRLIETLRKDFAAPDAKFVLATIGFNGNQLAGHGLTVAKAQLAVDGKSGKIAKFKGNVSVVDARPFWKDKSESPTSAGHHYNHNAETYMEVGNALGKAMIELIGGGQGN